jgi:hypothetical protein
MSAVEVNESDALALASLWGCLPLFLQRAQPGIRKEGFSVLAIAILVSRGSTATFPGPYGMPSVSESSGACPVCTTRERHGYPENTHSAMPEQTGYRASCHLCLLMVRGKRWGGMWGVGPQGLTSDRRQAMVAGLASPDVIRQIFIMGATLHK